MPPLNLPLDVKLNVFQNRGSPLEFVNLFRQKINFSRRVILLHINYTEIKS